MNLFESESFNWWTMNEITSEQVMDFSNSLENNLKITHFNELVKYLFAFKMINIAFRNMIITLVCKESAVMKINLVKLLAPHVIDD